jgi:hypothetical protein
MPTPRSNGEVSNDQKLGAARRHSGRPGDAAEHIPGGGSSCTMASGDPKPSKADRLPGERAAEPRTVVAWCRRDPDRLGGLSASLQSSPPPIHAGEGRPIDDVAATLGVSRATLFRHLQSNVFSRQ